MGGRSFRSAGAQQYAFAVGHVGDYLLARQTHGSVGSSVYRGTWAKPLATTPLVALLCLSYPQRSYLKITGLASGSALYGARDLGGA